MNDDIEIIQFPDFMRRVVREQKVSDETRDYVDALAHRLDSIINQKMDSEKC